MNWSTKRIESVSESQVFMYCNVRYRQHGRQFRPARWLLLPPLSDGLLAKDETEDDRADPHEEEPESHGDHLRHGAAGR